MATIAATDRLEVGSTTSSAYERFAGVCAVLVGALTFLYSVSFIILVNEPLSSFCLLANGLLASAVLVALYERLRASDASFALWALLLGLAGSIGSAIHGGYDLAGVLHQHAPVDPKPLGYLGYLVAALQIILYLGRLIVFDAKNPVIVVPALIAGFLATPIFFIWLGVRLWRGARA